MSNKLGSLSVLATDYAHSLMEIANSEVPRNREEYQLSRYSNWNTLQHELLVHSVKNLPCALSKNILVYREDENTPSEPGIVNEAVFSIRGYLVEADLPPILRKHQLPLPAGNATQSVVLAAPNCAEFKKAIEAISSIWSYLSSSCPPDSLETWAPTTRDGQLTLEFATRYYSFPEEGDILDAFPDNIDPRGILRKGISKYRQYTSDNRVAYFERIAPSDTNYRYTDITPEYIRAGQLVEAQVRFETRCVGKNQPSFAGRICSIAILDRRIQMESLRESVARPLQLQSPYTQRIKRKVGFEDCVKPAKPVKKARIDDPAQEKVNEMLVDSGAEGSGTSS